MRVEFIEADKGDRIVTEIMSFALMSTSKNEPIVWLITPDDMEDYFSKDDELVANFDKLSSQILKDGYVKLTDYLFYTDPGYDEGEDFGDSFDDDGWDLNWCNRTVILKIFTPLHIKDIIKLSIKAKEK